MRMGPGRSLLKVIVRYTKSHQTTPPTNSVNTLKGWSTRYDWAAREACYDAEQDTTRTAARQREFQRGLALDYARAGGFVKIDVQIRGPRRAFRLTFRDPEWHNCRERWTQVDGEPASPRGAQ